MALLGYGSESGGFDSVREHRAGENAPAALVNSSAAHSKD